MKAEEIEFIEAEVKVSLMPEIKKAVPGVLSWVLRVVFPKLVRKITDFVISMVEHFSIICVWSKKFLTRYANPPATDAIAI